MEGGKLVALALFVLVGLCLGLLGAGGGILTVPLLVNFAGIDPHAAVPLSLAIVGSASLFGAAVSAWRGRVAVKAVLPVGAGGVVGAHLGAALAPRVPNEVLLLSFASIMVVAGGAMLRRTKQITDASGRPLPPDSSPLSGRTALGLVPIGLAVGVLTGFLGVGGGFLIVPALTIAASLDMRRATGTSLAVIVINSAAGLWGHARGERIQFGAAALYVAMAVAGMAGGLWLARYVPSRRLQQAFALLVLVMAAVIGATNLSRLLHGEASAWPL